MLLNKILNINGINDVQEEIKDLHNSPGIIIMSGYYSVTESYTTLIISHSSNMSKDFVNAIAKFKEHKIKPGILDLSYVKVENSIERMILYCKLVIKMKPALNQEKEINNFFSKLKSRENKMKEREIKDIAQCFTKEEIENFSVYNDKIDESPYCDFTKIKTNIPSNSGIYFIYDDYDLLYVGKADNLSGRLMNHFHGETNTRDISHNFQRIKFIEINKELLSDFENFYINFYKPRLNVSGVRTYRPLRYDKRYNYYWQNFQYISNNLRKKYTKKEILNNDLMQEFNKLKDIITDL